MDKHKGDIVGPTIRTKKHDFYDGIDVAIFSEVAGVSCSVVQSVVFEKLDENLPAPYCLQLNATSAQILIDDLWSCGVRPSEGTGSAGSLKATQNHLADIKEILFHKLGITKLGS